MNVNNKIFLNVIKLIIIIIAISLLGLIILSKSSLSSAGSSSSQSLTSTANVNQAYTILSPAKVPPKIAECYQNVSYNSSGVPSPLQCSNGLLNSAAWDALSAQEPKVMTLGYSPNLSSVQAAICNDINAAASDSLPGADNAIEASVIKISALYYGWDFTSSALNDISQC